MEISLTKQEFDYLTQGNFLPRKLLRLIYEATQSGDRFIVDLTDEDADNIRDHCGDRLQEVGFNETYEPTEIGMIIEDLIDKFFTG